ncbi:hypothetical protein niasHT_010589 [Heterodera trifolii]|uniref:Uncharacterized protein n=1 Tax=Heterodera trifolii TaxID=157864 RepID=A0ABD2L277_9BILA
MELFVLRHAEYERLYNCTGLDIGAIPLEKRQFVPESIAICVLCAIYYILYLPCMYSIWKHLRENSCYKLLFYKGITDFGILWILGFFSGWLNLHGAVFCSHPKLIYFIGVAVSSLWIAESTADLVLAFNRCLEIGSPSLSHLLFSGRRVSLWLFGCSLYALYWALFLKPAVYSSLYFGWFFYPFSGYRSDNRREFENRLQIVQDIAVAFFCPFIYLILAIKLFVDIRKNGAVVSELSAMQAKTFVQVFLISLTNILTGTLYVFMQWYEVDQWAITLAEFSWFHAHGLPPVIYLALNKTIRHDCRLLYLKVFKRNRTSSSGGVTVVQPALT